MNSRLERLATKRLADNMKYDYGCSTETRGAWRRSIGREKSTTSKEMSVDMIVRRPELHGEHTCLSKQLRFLPVSMLGSVIFLQIPD